MHDIALGGGTTRGGRAPRVILASGWGRWGLAGSLAAALASAGLALSGTPMPSSLLGALLVLLFGLIAAGVSVPRSGVFGWPLISVETTRRELALTFDDGPDPRVTPQVLDLLDAHGQRGTFFVIGERAEAHPELLREIVRRGHAVENHSLRHSYLTPFQTPRSLAAELVRTSEIIAEHAGATPRWFRAPVGLLSPRVTRAAAAARLELVAWTASARDGGSRRDVGESVKRLESALVPGAILVLHDGSMGSRPSIAVPVLREILGRMSVRGLVSVTLDQLLCGASVSGSAERGTWSARPTGARAPHPA